MYKIGLLYGDGIGPEITKATEEVLKSVTNQLDIEVEFPVYPMGWEGINDYQNPVPDITIEGLKTCDAWVFAPHDSAAYPDEYFHDRPNPSGTMRQTFRLFSNARPAKSYPGIKSRVGEADVIVFRENLEGELPDRNMFKGYGEFMPSPDVVVSNSVFTRQGCEQIAHSAFQMAMTRDKKVTIVHKANVVKMGTGFFRDICYEVGEKYYPEVEIDDYHIDAMTAHMVKRLNDFDVIVTTNLFGDILSDLACELTGSLGLGPSINTNENQCMAQAAHGSAPDIAGQNIANPVGLMLSAVMMLDWLATKHEDERLREASELMEASILQVMKNETVTPDMGGNETTTSFTELIIKELEKQTQKV